MLFASADPGRLLMLDRGPRPTRLWEALAGTASLADYLPGLVAPTPLDFAMAGIWAGAVVLLLIADRFAFALMIVSRPMKASVTLVTTGTVAEAPTLPEPPPVMLPAIRSSSV